MIPLLVYNNTLIDSIEAHPPLPLLLSLSTPALFSQIHRWQKERFFLSVPFKWISSKKKKVHPVKPSQEFPHFRMRCWREKLGFFPLFHSRRSIERIHHSSDDVSSDHLQKPLSSLTIKFLTPFILVEFLCCFVKPTKSGRKILFRFFRFSVGK